MEKWNTSHYKKLLLTDKRKALKYVMRFNNKLMKNEEYSIPETLTITINKFIQDATSQFHELKKYKKTQLMFLDQQPDVVAQYIAAKKYNVSILNFAESKKLGNDVFLQEAELCRVVPALQSSLLKMQYPPNCYDTIYFTPDIELVRNSHKNYETYDDIIKINVISASFPKTTVDKNKIYNTMEMIFLAPKLYSDSDAIVLSIWGDVKVTAKLFVKLLSSYKCYYRVICFAIPKSDNSNDYDILHKIINKNLAKSE
jgi:hypothetical protein